MLYEKKACPGFSPALAGAAGLFLLLSLHSTAVAGAAREALALCGRVIIPSLLPFFACSGLMASLGLSRALAGRAGPLMGRLFSLSGTGAAVFLTGITGGYPLGAAMTAQLYRQGQLSREEANALLSFANNSGPAFILGAAGGIFGSGRAGLLLYLAHVLGAVLTGMLLCGGKTAASPSRQGEAFSVPSFSAALPGAVESALRATLLVCGYVILFSVLRGLLDALGLFSALSGALHRLTGLGIGGSRGLLTGLLEIGSGIGALGGQGLSPLTMGLCGFILGWGGLSVQFQSRAMLEGTDLRVSRLLWGKLLHGLLSGLLSWAVGFLPL